MWAHCQQPKVFSGTKVGPATLRMQKLFGENYNRDKNYENIWSAQVLERQLGVATLTGWLPACLQNVCKSNPIKLHKCAEIGERVFHFPPIKLIFSTQKEKSRKSSLHAKQHFHLLECQQSQFNGKTFVIKLFELNKRTHTHIGNGNSYNYFVLEKLINLKENYSSPENRDKNWDFNCLWAGKSRKTELGGENNGKVICLFMQCAYWTLGGLVKMQLSSFPRFAPVLWVESWKIGRQSSRANERT